MTIGIIGYGRFGSLLAKVFLKHSEGSEVKVYSNLDSVDGKLFYSLGEVVRCDLVIPCVPISAMKEVLVQVKGSLGDFQPTVIDVCSVKKLPVKWIEEILGDEVKMIASHPMFGPDSTDQGKHFKGLKMVLHNVSAEQKVFEEYKQFWEGLGVKIIDIDPDMHDRYAAYSMNYNHLMGRVGEMIGLRPTPIDTVGFKTIYGALKYVTNDSWELFRDMQNFNPYAKEMRQEVRRAFEEIEERLVEG